MTSADLPLKMRYTPPQKIVIDGPLESRLTLAHYLVRKYLPENAFGKMTSNELPKASKSASKVSVLLILSAIHHHEDMQNNPGNKPKQTHQAVMAQPLTQALQRPGATLRAWDAWEIGRSIQQHWKVQIKGLVKYREHGQEIMHVVVPS